MGSNTIYLYCRGGFYQLSTSQTNHLLNPPPPNQNLSIL